MREGISRRFIRLTTLLIIAILASGAVVTVYPGGIFGISGLIYWMIDFPDAVLSCWLIFALGGIALRLPHHAWTAKPALPAPSPGVYLLIALCGLILALLGTRIIYFEYALSLDEWMPRLQAEIFRSGDLTATVSPEWRPWGHMMYQNFATFDPQTGQLASGYRPGLAALIAAFDFAGLGAYISSFLFAGSVFLVAIVTRQIVPTMPRAPLIAAILMVTSSQALFAGMTTYAMPAHLFFNLLWLHLFLRDRIGWHVVAALIGVLTASLHQVHMHLFFALPFLVLFLRPFRPVPLLIYGAIYLSGHLLVIGWDDVLISSSSGRSVQGSETTMEIVARLFTLPSLTDLTAVWTNLGRLVLWQNLAFAPLLFGWFLVRKNGNRLISLLIASTAFSLLPYLFLMPDQGHGWGYRYLHGLLGNLFIVAAVGWSSGLAREGYAQARAFVVLLMVATPLIMIPLRGYQVSGFVGKYFGATTWVHQLDADVVLVDNYSVPVGGDIPRNSAISPTRPVGMFLSPATPAELQELCARYDVLTVSGRDFEALGLAPVKSLDTIRSEDHFFLLEALDYAGCRQNDTVRSAENAGQG